ncbi:nuclear transport factor 2 family protein [Nocardioides sp. TF02-7]|uniref:nuclear transport factor 2 family protein n=1 Tax=Nocardioides sp. TF02-7 TaxID=2917724 RepID=UPI001F06008D|nr:nuclear transport factor 2 family protein [Nocardioides sp. TF02-7]UMG92485.1 nuclear transport factor 2 family protein [Nocardioides sp. TF02-7]
MLERTALGGLVRMKRERLEGAGGAADFAVAAMAKDLALLAAEAPSAAGLRGALLAAYDAGAVAADADVAELVVVDAPGRALSPEHRLSLAPGVTAPPEVLEPLCAYVAGHATGDPGHHRAAFLPTAHVEGVRDGRFVSWGLDDFCALFTGRPADDEADRRRTVDEVTVRGTVATAAMTLHHGPDVFGDLLLLVRTEDGWRIANKVYDRRAVEEDAVTVA